MQRDATAGIALPADISVSFGPLPLLHLSIIWCCGEMSKNTLLSVCSCCSCPRSRKPLIFISWAGGIMNGKGKNSSFLIIIKSLESLCHNWQKNNSGKTQACSHIFNFAQGFAWKTARVQGQHWNWCLLRPFWALWGSQYLNLFPFHKPIRVPYPHFSSNCSLLVITPWYQWLCFISPWQYHPGGKNTLHSWQRIPGKNTLFLTLSNIRLLRF